VVAGVILLLPFSHHTNNHPTPHHHHHLDTQDLLDLLYSIADGQARKEGYVHRGITCNGCKIG
jgi:hypothetical protein